MTKLTIEMPAATDVRRSDKSVVGKIDWSKLSPAVAAAILETGAKVILLNTYNGKGKESSDADRQAALDKKLAAWYRGEFNVVERGDSFKSLMREAFYAAEAERLGQSVSAVEKTYGALIEATLPKVDGKPAAKTVDNLFLAVATKLAEAKGKPVDEVKAALEAKYSAAAEELAKARAAATAEVDVSGIDIDL